MVENNSSNIDKYVKMLIENKKFRNKAYEEYVDNNFGISDITGTISSSVLKQAICYARRNRKIRDMLSDVLLYVNSESITDENFQLLLKFPNKYRKTYLSNICHAELSFYQMQIINRHPLTMEAFVWLFDKICAYDCFTKEDLLSILRENPDVSEFIIRDCVNSALNQHGCTEKIQAVQSWLKRLSENS